MLTRDIISHLSALEKKERGKLERMVTREDSKSAIDIVAVRVLALQDAQTILKGVQELNDEADKAAGR